MKTLGIDYGRAKVGLAIAVGDFPEPLKVIRYKDEASLLKELKQIIDSEKIEKIVVGISEGKMAEETKRFAEAIKQFNNVTVEFSDETLSSKDAQRLSRESGVPQKKRHAMEDAYAATIMLQNYLESVK